MKDSPTLSNLLEPKIIGAWIAKRPFIWQNRFLGANELASFANERGITIHKDQIVQLWQLGLLRADYVLSTRELKRPGLLEIEAPYFGERRFYVDARSPGKRKRGYLNAVAGLGRLSPSIQPFFHPFRYFVLYHLARIFDLNIIPLQPLLSVDGYHRLVTYVCEFMAKWSSSEQFVTNIRKWNDLAAVPIAAEPCYLPGMAGKLSFSVWIGEESLRQGIEEHKIELTTSLRQIGLDRLEALRQDLCVHTQLLDDNRDVHTILRLGKADVREKLRGRLGGAILLRTMAEIARRACEDVFSTQLREEDELGLGWFPPNLKKEVYGSNRILDAPDAVKNEFLRQYRLDHGVKLRWYVEGDTEYHALDSVFGGIGISYVELVNLRGQVVQRNVLSLRDNLRADIKNGVFSHVSIDGDRSDNIMAVRKAAKDDEICGVFHISTPDFEFANFTVEELEEVLWQIASEKGAPETDRAILKQAISGTTTMKKLLDRAHSALPNALAQVNKGAEWGKRLMRHAAEKGVKPDGRERPIIQAIKLALTSKYCSYHVTRQSRAVDPKSGKLVPRAQRSGKE